MPLPEPKTFRCNYYDEKGAPLLIDGRAGCPRQARACRYSHPDDQEWAFSRMARPRLDPQGYMYTVTATSGQSGERSPPRQHSSSTSSPFARSRKSPVPRSSALSASGARSPYHARTPPRTRSPPSGPRIASRPRSRTPVRQTELRARSPGRPMSRERHATAPDTWYTPETGSGTSSASLPQRKPGISAQGPHRDHSSAASPHGSWPSGPGTVVGRERSHSGAVASVRPRDESPPVSVTPVTLVDSMESRYRPISLAPRVQTNGTKLHASSHSSAMPPPPLPSMLPPPVPPSLSHSDATPTAPPNEPSYIEKRDLWVERIKLLTDASIARAEHVKLTKEVEKYQRITRSAQYSSISAEDQARLNDQLSDVARRLEAKKDELNSILPRLIAADFWGVAVSSPPKLDEFRKEMENIIAELSKNMQKLHAQYEEMRAKKMAASGALVALDTPGLQAHEGPPSKRRRLSAGETTLTINGDERKPNVIYSGDAEELHDRVLDMESRLTDLENELVERDNNLVDEVEDLVRERLENEQPKPKAEIRSRSPPLVAQPPPPGSQLERIEAELTTTGSQVEELAIEVADLITQMDARDQEHARLAQENQLLRERIAALQQQQSVDVAAIEANKAEIQALNAAVQSYISQAPTQVPLLPPPPLQQAASMDEILSKIHPSLIQSLHEDMEPLLQETHRTIRALLQDQLNNVYGTLVSKMTPTMKTVDIVAQWMDRVRRGEPFLDNPVQSHNAQ